MNEFELENTIISMFNQMKASINASPLNLGGIIGSGGGIGGPPGGYVGYLPQYRVAFDATEDESMVIPTGVPGPSLLTNLNRIRGRIAVLEESGSGGGLSDQILLFHSGIITEFLPTASGLTSALSTAVARDTVLFPPATTISGLFTLPAGVTLRGADWSSEISGTLSLSPNETGYSSSIENMQFTPGTENYSLQVAVANTYQGVYEYIKNCRFTTTVNKYCVNLEITWGDWTDILFTDCIFDTLDNPSYVFKESATGDSLTAELIRCSKWGTLSMKWSDIPSSSAYSASSHLPEMIVYTQTGASAFKTIIPSGVSANHLVSANDSLTVFTVDGTGKVISRGGFAVYSGAAIIDGISGIINNVESITVSGMDILIVNQNPVATSGLITNLGTEESNLLNLGIKVYDDGVLKASDIQEIDFLNATVVTSNKKATVQVVGSGGGGGDMFKSIYDSNDDGKIDITAGGTGAGTAQDAINALTSVAGATNEHVLTKDTSTGNAIWKAVTASGNGDMLKSVYDTDNNSIVDSAEKINGIDVVGISKYYGTNSSGTPGFFDLPTSSGTISGQAVSDLTEYIDGYLAVTSGVVRFSIPRSGEINRVDIVGDILGTSGSTIVDVHKNGTSIFTTQANRPSLAYNDANGIAYGIPDITSIVDGDILSLDIDQVASESSGLGISVVMNYTSGGSSHDAVTVADTSTINLVLSGQHITANVIPSGINAADLSSGSTTDGFVLTADGAGNTEWRVAASGSGAVVREAIFTRPGDLFVGVGVTRYYNLTGSTLTISKTHGAVNTAPAGIPIIIDINIDGTTIFTTQSNRLQIAAGANTGSTTSMDIVSWPNNSYITADLDQVGSSTTGSDLTVTIVC